MRHATLARLVVAAAATVAGSAGCNILSGLSDLKIAEATSTGGSGGSMGGSGGMTTGGSGGMTTGGSGGTGGSAGSSTGGSTCGDDQLNGTETDTDCGGSDCPKCAAGRQCLVGTDCQTEICATAPNGNGERCAKATHIAVGAAHACAVLDNASVHCWGANDTGQLGVSGITESPTPVEVPLAKVADVTAGGLPKTPTSGHTCALNESRQVYCWGANDAGQLGQGDTAPSDAPLLVATLSNVGSVAAGGEFSCAVLLSGDPFCWGANEDGQMGDGGGAFVPEPIAVPEVDGVKGFAAGARHVCAALTAGTVTCWGNNDRSQIALPMTGIEKPNEVTGLQGISGASAGQDFGCAWGAGTLSCWGDNTDLELTDDVAADHVSSPAAVSLTGVVEAALGADGETEASELGPIGGHACALLDTGKVTCWGNDRSGQLGRGTISVNGKEGAPAEIAGLDDVEKVATGTQVSCAILKTGAVRCWGKNDHGQLGMGEINSTQSTPVAVAWP
jgi:alpha-tubulin suppressor-like RCC1 family protein